MLILGWSDDVRSFIDFSLVFKILDLVIFSCFFTIEQIFEKCASLSITGNEFLNAQFEELKHKSPTSLKISLKQIRDASKMTLKDELIMEYRMVQRCLEIGDFFEGVRAMLVDKDRKPNWQPSNIKDVDEGRVNKFFEVLGNLDLVLTN